MSQTFNIQYCICITHSFLIQSIIPDLFSVSSISARDGRTNLKKLMNRTRIIQPNQIPFTLMLSLVLIIKGGFSLFSWLWEAFSSNCESQFQKLWLMLLCNLTTYLKKNGKLNILPIDNHNKKKNNKKSYCSNSNRERPSLVKGHYTSITVHGRQIIS